MMRWRRALPWAMAATTLAVVVALLWGLRGSLRVHARWHGEDLVVGCPIDFAYEVTHVVTLSPGPGPTALACARLPEPALSVQGESITLNRVFLEQLNWVPVGGGPARPPRPGARVEVLWRRLERSESP